MTARDAAASEEKTKGSITLVALCMTIVIGIALASHLALCSRSAQSSARALNQAKTAELAQTGLEEALWALNQNTWTSSGPEGNTTWSTIGANRTVTLNYVLRAPAASGQVVLTVDNYASSGPTWPSITSSTTLTLPSGESFTKTLQALTGPAPLFGNAIASAESYVSFLAGGTVDSWNSDPDNNPATPPVPYSFTAGNPSNYAAVIAGRGNGINGVILTQAAIRGYVATFGLPVSYSTSGSPAAAVIGPATPSGTNVDSTRLGKSAFVPVSPAFSISLPPTNGANFGGLVNNALDLLNALLGGSSGADVYKTSGDLTILGLPLLAPNITINRPIKLIIGGDLTIAGLGKIIITATGSLDVFVAGDVSIGGLGIDNQTNEPRKLALFCSSGSTSDALEYTTTRNFCGVIYCENKPIDIRQNATFYGALLSRQYVRFSANATAPVFHYDMALRHVRFSNVTTPYLVTRLTAL
jgi:hypothetical protein